MDVSSTFCNISVTLFLVSGLTQKCQKCHLVCQMHCTVIPFSHIRILDGEIICCMKVMGTMKHEKITRTLTVSLRTLNATLEQGGGLY